MSDALNRIDPAFARALDSVDIPPPSEDFAARIAAAAKATAGQGVRPLPVNARRWTGRSRHRRWPRRALIGLIAVGLTSATAVAAGVFGDIRIDLPQVAHFFAPVAAPQTSSPPAPKREHVAPRRVAAQAVEVASVDPPVVAQAEPRPTVRQAIRREIVINRIQRRLSLRGIDMPHEEIRARLERVRPGWRPGPLAGPAAFARAARLARVLEGSGRTPPSANGLNDGVREFAQPAPVTARPLNADQLRRIERLRQWRQWRALQARRQALRRAQSTGDEGFPPSDR